MTTKSHLSIKSSLGLPPPSSNYKQGGNIKTDSLLWVKSRPDTWKHDNMVEYSQVANNQSNLPEYDKIHQNQMPDYAEVDAAMITFKKGNYEEATSPAAYASVTLVPSPGNPTGSMVSLL